MRLATAQRGRRTGVLASPMSAAWGRHPTRAAAAAYCGPVRPLHTVGAGIVRKWEGGRSKLDLGHTKTGSEADSYTWLGALGGVRKSAQNPSPEAGTEAALRSRTTDSPSTSGEEARVIARVLAWGAHLETELRPPPFLDSVLAFATGVASWCPWQASPPHADVSQPLQANLQGMAGPAGEKQEATCSLRALLTSSTSSLADSNQCVWGATDVPRPRAGIGAPTIPT